MNIIKKVIQFILNLFKRGTSFNNTKSPKTQHFEFKTNQKLTCIISSTKTANTEPKFIYFKTPGQTSNINYSATKLKPYWDIRYINEVQKFTSKIQNYGEYTGLFPGEGKYYNIGTAASRYDNSACIVQTKITDTIAGGCTINLYDTPQQNINYGGPQISYLYQFRLNSEDDALFPWKLNNNLIIQGTFNKVSYVNFGDNPGGGISFNLFLYNKKRNKRMNYVIGVYSFGNGWVDEKEIMFDPTTNTTHIPSVVKDGTKFTTKSPYSAEVKKINETRDEFFRVNISRDNLICVLNNLSDKGFGVNPSEWSISLIGIQSELEEQGKARVSFSFENFEVYSSKYMM